MIDRAYQHPFLCKVPGLLLISILIVTYASSTSSYQMALTEADKKEILSQLFEPEISASRTEKELVVLMSPRTDASWLLDLPGIRFKQLSYGEEKQTSEYYELNNVKIHRNYIEVWFSKGNYCKKTAKGYQFRKDQGKWKARIAGVSEIYTSSGTACIGCKTGSGSVYTLKNVRAQANEPPKELLLTGKVLSTNCKRSDTKYVHCQIETSLDFINQGNQPIIILQPHGEYKFWQGARKLALTKADSEAYNYVYNSAAWPSFYDTDEYRRLAAQLDQATPPANFTRVIPLGQSWKWKTSIHLNLAEENTCSGSTGVEIGWKEIKKLSAPVWLEVSYEMWPFNVERFKKNLGGQLKERWKRYGTLYLEGKLERYWVAHLTSEPIELGFQQVELN